MSFVVSSSNDLHITFIMDGVEVFVFDVFGTVVDWRSTIVNELKKLGQERSLPGTALIYRMLNESTLSESFPRRL